MAESNPKSQPEVMESEEQKMKRLEFVQVAAFHAVIFAAKVYNYAKDKSGPLKPGIHTVEGTVKTVVGPVYDKYHDVPVELLKFVDRKVDESMNKVQSHVPTVLKQVSTQAFSSAQKAPSMARSVVTEVKTAGVVETASGLAKTFYAKYEPAAKDLYSKYEPVAEHFAVSTWRSLNQLPLFPQVAQVVVPTASYYTEKYNQTIQLSAEKGHKVASYLPLVPTEKIAKAFSADKTKPMVSTGGAVEAH
ncbi:stress-related protein-like isoform X1 [Olea europaea var. sylvestris]|uniref:stress-related protein-like isoform X1 n=2 Tax=Olea europaea var. sylvestris TaxID=158386 RepID=UPI000C1CE2D4|nr:stress-related protein-like isoform X1 [Olea europaea var. sylvestris]